MSHCTVAGNSTGVNGGTGRAVGAGVYGALQIRSSAIATNQPTTPIELTDVAGGPPVSFGYNYVGFFGTLSGHTMSTDRGNAGLVNPFVGTGNITVSVGSPYSISTLWMVPREGGPLVDAGLARDVDGQPVTTDVRGAVRPFDFPSIAPQPGGDDSDMGAAERQTVEPLPTPTPTALVFAGDDMHVPEGCAQVDITLKRTGPKDGTTVATYYVNDYNVSAGAHQRSDFTRVVGQVTFAPGEDTKTIPILLSEDAYHEVAEDFGVDLLEVDGREPPFLIFTLGTIDDDDATDGETNPIDDNALFVCQHYHDFLSRHADPAGQAFWTARLEECHGDAVCLDRKRADVSAAFFLSIEFLNTGYYVIRVNKVAVGDRPQVPDYGAFLYQTQRVSRGVIVGQPGYEAVLEENKRRFVEEMIERSNGIFQEFFLDAHAGQTAAQYVDSLFANVDVTPTTTERDAAISAFGTGGVTGMAAALRSVVESGSVFNKLYNEAFVMMQYFAYLRRTPNDPPDGNFNGYQFWLDKLDSVTTAGEDAHDERIALARIRRAEMVRAFLRSAEYRGRFGGDPSRGNP
jgi:hypothetical protein